MGCEPKSLSAVCFETVIWVGGRMHSSVDDTLGAWMSQKVIKNSSATYRRLSVCFSLWCAARWANTQTCKYTLHYYNTKYQVSLLSSSYKVHVLYGRNNLSISRNRFNLFKRLPELIKIDSVQANIQTYADAKEREKKKERWNVLIKSSHLFLFYKIVTN